MKQEVKELLKAFASEDPPPNRQKAVTPDVLRDALVVAGEMTLNYQHTADLSV